MRAFATTTIVALLFAAACSAPDPGVTIPRAYQGSPSATTTATGPAPTGTPRGAPPPAPPSTAHDAGPPEPPPTTIPDASTAPPPATDAGGTNAACTPKCGTFNGTDCGCVAGSLAQGNEIQLGCESGGSCGCFQNQQLVGDVFDENGACDDVQQLAQLFIAQCGCPQ